MTRYRIVLQLISMCFIIFLSFPAAISDNLCTFAVLYSRRADFARCRSGYREGALHFGNASLTLCFWQFEITTREYRVKNIAEVDAAGRYMPSRWRAEGKLCPHARFYGRKYIPTAWVSLCLVYSYRLW